MIDEYQKWLELSIRAELKHVPEKVVEKASKSRYVHEIVLVSVCQKLCFNSQSEEVEQAFNRALIPEEPKERVEFT